MIYQVISAYFQDDCADELALDSTLFGTYGKQEGEGFNFHYQAHGYHPLLNIDKIEAMISYIAGMSQSEYRKKW